MTMLAALLCCGVMTVSAEGEENLAAGCAVEACGFNAYGGLTADVREAPELAVDGDADTKWDCNVQEHEGLEDGTLHWLILDLGESKTFNKIELKHASNCMIDKDYPEYNTREMVIETSEDKENWTECLHILNGDQKAVNTRWFDAVRARYIRLRILAPGTMDTDARLVEFAVYNSSEEPVEEADVPLGAAIATTRGCSRCPDYGAVGFRRRKQCRTADRWRIPHGCAGCDSGGNWCADDRRRGHCDYTFPEKELIQNTAGRNPLPAVPPV